MDKLTAVDWLMEQLKLISKDAYAEIQEQHKEAKEMEKKQHMQTFHAGFWITKWDKTKDDHFEDYYFENFIQ
jgi:hypothetical protein